MAALALAVRTVELLRFQPEVDRAGHWLQALSAEAPGKHLRVTPTTTYQGGADLLLIWGPGHPARFEPMRRQLAAGGHVLACDLAYWHRDRKIRVSIDAAHPQRWVLSRDWPAARLKADHVPIRDAWNPDGPVLVAGIGDKAKVQYGAAVVEAWEAAKIRECQQRGRLVVYRAKQRGQGQDIDAALAGKSLVITWHSNVAVDAMRLGIPVICRDGAAAAVYGPDLPADVMPRPIDPVLRDRFLRNLAWFQWAPIEAREMWGWLQEMLS